MGESLTLNRSVGDGRRWASEGPRVPWKPGNAGGGKGPWFWVLRTEPRRGDWPLGLTTPAEIRTLQKKLYGWAKRRGRPERRVAVPTASHAWS